MVVPLDFRFTVDAMPARAMKQASRRVNRAMGEHVIDKVLRAKFSESIKYDIPTVFRRRSEKYERRKVRLVGHRTPWVLTGRAKQLVPAQARVTATANGGRVILRAPWAGKAKPKRGGRGFAIRGFQAQQRAELEAIGKRQLDRMAAEASRLMLAEMNDPRNRRKRRVSGSGIT